MDQQLIETRITRNPAVLGGKPIIRGTRIAVSLVIDWINAGVLPEQILQDYPNLTREDIDVAVAYDNLVMRDPLCQLEERENRLP